jgi:hypothetical protein
MRARHTLQRRPGIARAPVHEFGLHGAELQMGRAAEQPGDAPGSGFSEAARAMDFPQVYHASCRTTRETLIRNDRDEAILGPILT